MVRWPKDPLSQRRLYNIVSQALRCVKKIRRPTAEPTPKGRVAFTPCDGPRNIFKGEAYDDRSLEPEPHRSRDMVDEWERFQDGQKRREQDQGIDH